MLTQDPLPDPTRRPSWLDLLLYLLGGFGLFAVASLAVGLAIQEITILASLALFALNVMCFTGAAYFLGVWRERLTWREFGLRPFDWRWLVVAVLAAVGLLPVRAAAALLAQALLGGGFDAMQNRLDLIVPGGAGAAGFVLTLLGAGLLVPLAEELYFRGLIHRWFWARFPAAPWTRVLLSSALFALGHFDTVGVVASSFFLGLLCAVAYERSRSLWLPIIIHALNNSFAVALVYAALALQEAIGG